MWLKEGGAEYTNTLFEEWKNGHDAMVEFIKDNQQFVLEECQEGQWPPCAFAYARRRNLWKAHILQGRFNTSQLKGVFGYDMYRNACQAVLSEYWDSYMDPTCS